MRRQSVREKHEDFSVPSLWSGRIPMASLIRVLAVAEHLNVRHAANALGVSQSSVSTRIKLLEEDLGVLLFERHARGVRLTETGRHFVEAVAAGIERIDHALKTAGTKARGDHGRLRIGVHALIPGGFVADLLSRYRDQFPDVEVQIAEGTARETVAQLRADRLDVTFVANALAIPDCHTRRIWTEPLLLALPANHRLAESAGVVWSDLAAETFLVRHGGTGPQVHDHILLRFAGHWPTPSTLRFEVERSTLMSMVAQGFGVTIVGQATSLIEAPGVAFLRILDEPEPVVFSAVWSPSNRSPVLSAFLDLAGKASRSASSA